MNPTVFSSIKNDNNNKKWLGNFNLHWPAYKSWYESKKKNQINSENLHRAEKKLKNIMPEILPIYQQLKHLTNDDPIASQFLTLYQPPAYLINCSQAVFFSPEPILIRNYDLSPDLSENTIFHTTWQGRKIISTNECLWGADDGINEAGLAISLTFGGRKNIGDGFGVPIILRYVLQTCDTVKQAIEQLKRIPSHMSYNITVLDKSGDYATVLISPDRETFITKDRVTTNHQQNIEWQEQAVFSKTKERKKFLENLITEKNPHTIPMQAEVQKFQSVLNEKSMIDVFHQSPLYSTNYKQCFGTVYTAVYKPLSGKMSYQWPGKKWQHSFNKFKEGQKAIQLYQNTNQTVSKELSNNEIYSNDLLSKEIKAQFGSIFDHMPQSAITNHAAFEKLKQVLNSNLPVNWNQFSHSMQEIWQ